MKKLILEETLIILEKIEEKLDFLIEKTKETQVSYTKFLHNNKKRK